MTRWARASDPHERLEQSAAQTRQQSYGNAVQSAKALIVGLDAKGCIILFNRAAERLSGHASNEISGKSFVDVLVPEEMRQRARGRLARASDGESGADGEWEVSLLTRAGHRRTVRWQLSYVPDARDEDVVLFAVGRDVSEANALHERTLRGERLAAVGTLGAGLAHEIRNPLNAALLHATVVERALRRGEVTEETVAAIGAWCRPKSNACQHS